MYERIARERAGNKKTMISIVMRDVKKAFDKVWHKGLIYKIMHTGIETPLLRILANFLHGRKARVRVNKSMGDYFNLHAGVPQGDVLSPTLYLIMCNDYPPPNRNYQNRNFYMQYADDFTQVIISKFHTTINHRTKEIHKGNIEEEIQKLNAYDKLWKIQTNMEKFQLLHLTVKDPLPIEIEGEIIPYKKTAKLLGLNFNYTIFYTKQVTINKRRADTELKQLFRFLNRKLKLHLYKALILPLITYPVVPLNIASKTQIKRLQGVQNKAIEWICNERWPIRCPRIQRHIDIKLEFTS